MIDETAEMECFSEKFKAVISKILDSDSMFVGTVALKGMKPISEVVENYWRLSYVMEAIQINPSKKQPLPVGVAQPGDQVVLSVILN